MRWCVVITVWAMGCQPSEDDPARSGLRRFRADLVADGYRVQNGDFVVSDYSGCCEEGAACFGNNPSTPYIAYALPPAPGQTVVEEDYFVAWGPVPDPDTSRSFRLRADEAVVFIGRTPPPVKYFGLRSYVVTRLTEDGQRQEVLGSLGASLNNQVVAREQGVAQDAVFDRPLVVITSADRAVEDTIRDRLIDAGFPPEVIHADRMTTDVSRMGTGEDADTFQVVMRAAVPDDVEAVRAWETRPDTVILRITPERQREATSPHPWPDLPRRGTHTGEDGYEEAVQALQDAVVASYPNHLWLRFPYATAWWETLECIDTEPTCAGDIRDRFTAASANFRLDGDKFAVLFGTNHELTGKAAYSSITVVENLHGIGVEARDSSQMAGTARYYLPNHPLADDLYAYVVARDCTGHQAACIALPSTCPGPTPDGYMHATARAYLEPATGAAPLPGELVSDRMVKFTPI